MEGVGTKADKTAAFKWLVRAAKRGCAGSALLVAELYRERPKNKATERAAQFWADKSKAYMRREQWTENHLKGNKMWDEV